MHSNLCILRMGTDSNCGHMKLASTESVWGAPEHLQPRKVETQRLISCQEFHGFQAWQKVAIAVCLPEGKWAPGLCTLGRHGAMQCINSLIDLKDKEFLESIYEDNERKSTRCIVPLNPKSSVW